MDVLVTSPSSIHLRPLSDADIVEATLLSGSFNWPHGIEDWHFVSALGAGVVGVDSQDRLVATAMWWLYGDSFATIGMVLVSKELQRQGLGKRLMSMALNENGQRNLLLNSTKAGERLYQSVGFESIGQINQHQGLDSRFLESFRTSKDLRPIKREDFQNIQKLDNLAFGMTRKALLDALFRKGQGLILERDGAIIGFSFRRSFGRGWAIGPVVAPDASNAFKLVAAHLASVKGNFARMDIPAEQIDLSRWLTEVNLPHVGSVTTMVKGVPPVPSLRMQAFAITNQALG